MTKKNKGGRPPKIVIEAELWEFFKTWRDGELYNRKHMVQIRCCKRMSELDLNIEPTSEAGMYIFAAYDLLAYWIIGAAIKQKETTTGINKLKIRTIILLARAYEPASGKRATRASASSGNVTGKFFDFCKVAIDTFDCPRFPVGEDMAFRNLIERALNDKDKAVHSNFEADWMNRGYWENQA